jgi:hypothetical protein
MPSPRPLPPAVAAVARADVGRDTPSKPLLTTSRTRLEPVCNRAQAVTGGSEYQFNGGQCVNTSVGDNQQVEAAQGTESGCGRNCRRKGRGLSTAGQMLMGLLVAVAAVAVLVAGCGVSKTAATNPASSTLGTVPPSSTVRTPDKPATTTSNTLTAASKSAAAAARKQERTAMPKVVPINPKATAVATRRHVRALPPKKVSVAVKPTAATAGKQKQAAVPTAMPPASKPAAATAGKQEQAGAWASPLRSLRSSSCGPSGCGPTGCP